MVQGTASIADALPRRPRRSSVPCTWDAWSAWRRRHIDRPARLSTPRAPSPSALGGTRRRASCRSGSRPGPSPSPTRACRRRVRPDDASKAGESVGCRRGRGRRTRPPPPFACCRKSRAGKLRHKRRRRDRARRTPSPASRENRRARTACGYRTAASAPASRSAAVHAVRSPRGSSRTDRLRRDRTAAAQTHASELGPFRPPALHEPVHAVMRAVVAAAAKLLEQADRRAPLAPRKLVFGLENRRQRLDPGSQFTLRLNLPSVDELGRARAQDLAHRVARYPKLPRNPLDPLAVLKMLEPDPRNRLHTRHPPTLPQNRKDRPQPYQGG